MFLFSHVGSLGSFSEPFVLRLFVSRPLSLFGAIFLLVLLFLGWFGTYAVFCFCFVVVFFFIAFPRGRFLPLSFLCDRLRSEVRSAHLVTGPSYFSFRFYLYPPVLPTAYR